VAVDFNGTVTLTDITGSLIPPPSFPITFTKGVWQGTVTITKAGTNTVHCSLPTDHPISGTSNPFYVEASTPTRLSLKPQNSVNIPAGGSISITAQLMDAYDNPVGSSGITCNVKVMVIAGTSGLLSATTTTTTNKYGQIATITYSVSTHAGDQAKILLTSYFSLLPPVPSPPFRQTSTTSPSTRLARKPQA